MAKSNPYYPCSTCQHKCSRNQLRASNGICLHCKTAYPHTQWMGGQQATLGQLLTLPVQDDRDLVEMADRVGLRPSDLISAAMVLKIKEWSASADIEKAVMQDLTLAKLSRR
jgi:hypothetical protein